FGALLLVVAALFYFRGVITSARERIGLARHRFHGKIRPLALFLLLIFLACGSFNYYNVSYVNTWPTRRESIEHMVLFEKALKQYESDPLPAIVRLRLFTDIFPAERRMSTRAYATLLNKTTLPIARLLLDGDHLSSYSIKYNGKQIPYSSPLIYPRAKFNLFGPKADTSMYRVYQFPAPLAPGDTAIIEINCTIENKGFTNNFSGAGILHHVAAGDGGLPEVGYDADEEYDNAQERKEYHLPVKKEETIAQDDSAGLSHISTSSLPGALLQFEATISTSGDQTIVAPGRLEKKWTQQGRNYFHFVQEEPTYPPMPFFSARYASYVDSLTLFNGKKVGIECYYQPGDATNLQRFVKGCKDGLDYFSRAYGPYPFDQLRLVESSIFTANYGSYPGVLAFSENFGWAASFNHAGLFDYPYFYSAVMLGQQWWMYQVAPNHTIGSNTISQGLAKYGAFILYEKKAGIENMTQFLKGESDWYLLLHHYFYEREKPLLFAKQDWVWDTKAGTVLFGLKDLIGEDSLNQALREFHDAYALRDHAPFAGSNDLYRYLKKHVPDSMQYYLSDTWEKITVYDNKILEAKLIPQQKKGDYIVHLKLDIRKTYADSTGNEQSAKNMHDFIDVGIFGQQTKSNKPLYFKRHRFSGGVQELDIQVTGKPLSVGIDPYFKLIDIKPDDNSKNF
ncbi:MAG TPA: hypothetical protein VK543_05370, partial [Puia sp.]|nr:hypothetical protein [Puia sp.]